MAKKITLEVAVKAITDGVGAKLQGVRDGLSKVSDVAGTLDHGMQIAEKAAKLAAKAFEETAGKALKFRDASDPAARAVEHWRKETLLAEVAAGDALLPTLQGLIAAYDGLVGGVGDLSDESRELIATGVAEYTFGFAKAIAWVGTSAAMVAAAPVSGLKEGFALLKQQVIEAGSAISGLPIQRGTAAAEAYENATRDLSLAVQEQETREKSLKETLAGINAALEEGKKKAIAAAGERTKASRVHTEEEKKALEQAAKDEEAYNKMRLAHQDRIFRDGAKLREEVEKRAEEREQKKRDNEAALDKRYRDLAISANAEVREKERTSQEAAWELERKTREEAKATAEARGEFTAGLIMDFIQIARTADNATDAIVEFGEQVATMLLQKALTAGLGALFSAVSGPVGAIGDVAGGIASGFFGGHAGGMVPAFAGGGVVDGTGFGRDSRLIRAMPREVVVDVAGVNQARSGLMPAALRNAGAGGSGGGDTHVTVHVSTLVPPTPGQMDDLINRHMLPSLKRAQKARRF